MQSGQKEIVLGKGEKERRERRKEKRKMKKNRGRKKEIENKKRKKKGSLGGAVVWHLPLAQDAILETLDRIPRRASGAWSLLLPLPVSLPLSLSVCV